MKKENFKFENLRVYQKARELAKRVYILTSKWPREYLYDLTAQFRRAILSVLLNIAEGSGRSKKDFARYLSIAIGSCKECAALVDLAADLHLLTEVERTSLRAELIEIVMMLEGLKKALR